MNVFRDLNQLPEFKNAVITIGSFDGVHRGHQRIIEKINHLARSIEGESVVITFHPHPRLIVYPKDASLQLLCTTEEKIQLLEKYGVDNVVVVPFTVEFSQLSADEYIEKFLVDKFHPKYIVIGYDHRFGLNRQGDINYLRWYGSSDGYEVLEIARQEVDEIAVSSTKIRNALNNGEVKTAELLLGHPYTLTGKVVHGQKIGGPMGFPTANLELTEKEKLSPPDGIYAVVVRVRKLTYGGMLYIGKRPTLKGAQHRTIEVNIFDFEEDIYGDEVQLDLIGFIRFDQRFDSLEDLRNQLSVDRESALALLSKRPIIAEKKKTWSKLAIVILNYNGKGYLQKFLPSVLDNAYAHQEVVVADNGSDDKSLRTLAKEFPTVKRLDLQRNHGFAKGYNLALHQIEADYYLLLNSDVEVSPHWIEPLIEVMDADEKIAACQPKIRDYNERGSFEYAGASGGWLDFLGYPFCRGRIFATVEEDKGQYDEAQEIFWATGAAMLVRSSLFHQLGGFDADYFAHAEEIDLCWRIKRAGYKVVVAPQSVVYHIGGGTLTYNTPRKTYLNFRNTLYTIFKNEPIPKLVWLLPLRFVLDGFAGVLFLFQGKIRHIGSILKAHFHFYLNFPFLLRKRAYYQKLVRTVRQKDRPNMATGRYPGSIVWEYYALGRRRFQEIFK